MNEINDYIIENGVLIKYVGKSRGICLPEGIREIGDGAFARCENLLVVNIPEGVVKVGNDAFKGCVNLFEVRFPETLTHIGIGAFWCCNKLLKIHGHKSIKKIASYTFFCCPNLRRIYLPDGVTSVGNDAFRFCHRLESIRIPKSLTHIADEAFFGCSGVKFIDVDENNENYKTIDGNLYSKDGKKLILCAIANLGEAFSVPNGVEVIGKGAFYHSPELNYIVLPRSVKFIDKGAFNLCDKLVKVLYEGTREEFGNIEIAADNTKFVEAVKFFLL